METSKDFVRAIRARHGVTSDYQLAELLGITRQAVSKHKTGISQAFSEETGIRIAELLDLPEEYVQSCLAAERAKDTKVRKVWERLANLTRVAVLAPVAFAVTFAVTPSPAEAAGPSTVYYVKLC